MVGCGVVVVVVGIVVVVVGNVLLVELVDVPTVVEGRTDVVVATVEVGALVGLAVAAAGCDEGGRLAVAADGDGG